MKKKFLLRISTRGQSIIELAISLALLVWLLSGAVEFGIALFQYVQLRDAAQEGALYGSINPPKDAAAIDAIKNRVLSASSSPIDLKNDPNVVVSVAADKNCEGGALTVTVSYPHKVFMPFMTRIMGSTRLLEATVTDTILIPPPPC